LDEKGDCLVRMINLNFENNNISKANGYKYLVSGAIALVFLDLLLLTKLNALRLYPLFPANFYFSYSVIAIYASIAFLYLVGQKRVSYLFAAYLLLIFYMVVAGFFYGNKNTILDFRYWALGVFCTYLFTRPPIIEGILTLNNKSLNFVLFTEFLLALTFYIFPGLLGFSGYGMGVPAYLFAYYMARSHYLMALLAFTLTFIQGKRGFIVAASALLLLSFYVKNKPLFLSALALALIIVAVIGGDSIAQYIFNMLRVDYNSSVTMSELVEKASLGRVNEYVGTLDLMDGFKWLTGLGLGFEFERLAYNMEFRGMSGYTHTTPYNFYLNAGLLGMVFFIFFSWKSFSKSMAIGKAYGKYEPLYISVIAFTSCFFSFWSAVSPWFWVFLSIGVGPVSSFALRGQKR
jgi:hypothetical protein